MTEKIFQTKTKLSKISKDRPKSLKTGIPTQIRDILELKQGDYLIWELYQEKGKKYAKISKEFGKR